jgi:hypothetical protein
MSYIYPHRSAHLLALARLPHTYTLYSLDQYGISFNTLYAQCEPQGPMTAHPRGTFKVVIERCGGCCVRCVGGGRVEVE